MNNLENLYRQVIMEHYKNPRNKGLTDDQSYRKLHLKNPSCGDDITIQSKIANGQITDIRHEGTGCSICCSSASVMSETLKGKRINEAEAIIDDFYGIIKGEEPKDPEALDEALAYQGVSKFPARVKCATLAWKAMGALLAGDEGEKREN
jgi:SUF system NifU family Fe-S assembly protein